MMAAALFFLVLTSVGRVLSAGETPGELPVRGFAISAPRPERVDDFVDFVTTELVPARINTLVLRVDYNFEYESHPELRDERALSRADVRKLVTACRRGGIRVIPQVNLLGHQSWAEKIGNLLREYPQLDETPWVQLPETYKWPNADGLYCKSYCPLHPEVHDIVFALVDELVEVFGADAFHAGLDEVFYLGDDRCPRCAGHDPAKLYAGEVRTIRDHLAESGVELWMWGDRLIDGRATGIGMWEASMNRTHRAIDLIPKDVVIADWHYERADPTAVLFAMKGFTVVTCSWNRAEVALEQIRSTRTFRANSTPAMRGRFAGVMQTIWTDAGEFLDQYYGSKPLSAEKGDPVGCAREFLAAMKDGGK